MNCGARFRQTEFQLQRRLFRQLDPSAEIMRIEKRFDVFQAVTGDGRDLRNAAPGKGETRNGRTAQIVKMEIGDAGLGASSIETGAKSILRPRPPTRVDQHPRRAFSSPSKKRSKVAPTGIDTRCPPLADAGLTLAQVDRPAVEGAPRQSEEIALALTRPERDDATAMTSRLACAHELSDVFGFPNDRRPVSSAVQPPAILTRINALIKINSYPRIKCEPTSSTHSPPRGASPTCRHAIPGSRSDSVGR